MVILYDLDHCERKERYIDQFLFLVIVLAFDKSFEPD